MSEASVKTILGTMEMYKRMNQKESEDFAQVFTQNRQDAKSVIEVDTAYMYGGTKTEQFLGKMKFRLLPEVEIATKANPFQKGLSLSPECVRMQLEASLKHLQVPKVKLFYLHAPDHNTPIIETLSEVNKMHEEGKFEQFGLSNFASWEVAEVYTICKMNSWVLPTVYQGMYNCLTRMVEKELIPCLRFYGIKFYAYNPLAGGILTGKHKYEDWNKTEPGRFFGNNSWNVRYRKRFWNEVIFKSVDEIQKSLNEVYGDKVSLTEASLRWIYHHSILDGQFGDGVILGASSTKQLVENLDISSKGPLDEKVVKVMEDCWSDTCFSCPNYFR